MIARALHKYIRVSPKKVRLVSGLLKGKKVAEALNILASVNKKSARIIKTVVESALNNAVVATEKKLGEADLYISKIVVDGGPVLKRFRAMTMGRAGVIRKRTSHILVELEALKKEAPDAAKKVKPTKVKPRKK
jgi:large subunit ribosomal protein L22